MGRKQGLGLEIRKLIIQERQKGSSFREIVEKFSCSKTCVEKIWKKFEKVGQIRNLPGRGRKRVTFGREDSLILRKTRSEPGISSTGIKEKLNLNISTQTIRNRLHENSFYSRMSLRKPLITKTNKRDRLEFAKKNTLMSQYNSGKILYGVMKAHSG